MDYICNTADRLELGCLTEFQGGLKQRTAEDIEKIKKSIRRHGFAFPFFVWSHGMRGVQGFNCNQDNYFDRWEPIRSYCEAEIKKIGESDKKIAVGIGYKDARTVNHWYSESQWEFINSDNVEKVKKYAKSKNIDVFLEYEKIKKEWYQTRAYFDNTHDNMNNVWHFDRTSKQEREGTGDHATPKPIALCARAIKSSSRPGEIVLDFFGGSGSTLIACEQTGRRCYMCELEPCYIDVIIQRWETLTGEKAELLERAE